MPYNVQSDTSASPSTDAIAASDGAVDASAARSRRLKWSRKAVGVSGAARVALWVLLTSAAALLLLASLAVKFWFAPNADAYKDRIAAYLSKQAGAVVRIEQVQLQMPHQWDRYFWLPQLRVKGLHISEAGAALSAEISPSAAAKSGNESTQTSGLTLGSAELKLSWPSLLSLGTESVVIEDVALHARREASGQVWVAGFPLGQEKPSANPYAELDWLLNQRSIEINRAQAVWNDQLRAQTHQAPVLRVPSFSLSVRTEGSSHTLYAQATPPSQWGDTFSAAAVFESSALINLKQSAYKLFNPAWTEPPWRSWSGKAVLNLPKLSVAAVRPYVDLPIAVSEARGSAALVLDIDKGLPIQALIHTELNALEVNLGDDDEGEDGQDSEATDLKPLQLKRLAGRFVATQTQHTPYQHSIAVAADGLEVISREGQRWVGGQLSMGLTVAHPATAQRAFDPAWLTQSGNTLTGKFNTAQVDIATAALIANRLPLSAQLRKALAGLNPSGAVNSLELTWTQAPGKPLDFSAKGDLAALSIAASPASGGVGLSGAQLQFDTTATQGHARIKLSNTPVLLPMLRAGRVAVEQGEAQFKWTQLREALPVGAPVAGAPNSAKLAVKAAQKKSEKVSEAAAAWRVDLDQLGLQTPHGNVQLKGFWQTHAPGESVHAAAKHAAGFMQLEGDIKALDLPALPGYLPSSLPDTVDSYLRSAFKAGKADNVQLRINGPLHEFPFAKPSQPDSVFSLQAPVSGVDFDYLPRRAVQTDAIKPDLPWPALKNLTGLLTLKNTQLELSQAQAQVEGYPDVQVKRAGLKIPNLNAPVLEVQLELQASAAEALRFNRESALNAVTQGALAQAQARGGSLAASVQLQVGLGAAAQTHPFKASGKLDVADAQFQFNPTVPEVQGLSGSIEFSGQGVKSRGLTGKVLGGVAQIGLELPTAEASTLPSPETLRLSVQGRAQAAEIWALPQLNSPATAAALRPYKDKVSGELEYDLRISLNAAKTMRLQIASSLQGLRIDLPAPLGKAAEALKPLEFRLRTGPQAVAAAADAASGSVSSSVPGPTISSPPSAQQPSPIAQRSEFKLSHYARPLGQSADQMADEAAHILTAHYVVEQTPATATPVSASALAAASAAKQTVRGAVTLGAVSPLEIPDEGVAALVSLPQINLDTWRAALRGNPAGLTAAATAPAATGSAVPNLPRELSSVDVQTQDFLPTQYAVVTEQLVVAQRALNQVVAGGSQRGGLWRVNLGAQEANGYIEVEQGQRDAPDRITAKLAHLHLGEQISTQIAQDVQNLFDKNASKLGKNAAQDPSASLPELNLSVEDLKVQGIKLGSAELVAKHALRDKHSAWRVERLRLDMPEAVLTGQGAWQLQGGEEGSNVQDDTTLGLKKSTRFDFGLEVKDGGALLTKFGLKDALKAGNGLLSGQIGWAGSPFDFDRSALSGSLKLNLGAGQILKVDPGAAKLLGLLSLQSLPRRLLFDFRDLSGEGFAFDTIKATVQIDEGMASTKDFDMLGLYARVRIAGSTHLARETQNLHIRIIPEVNAGGASVLLAFVNPITGIGSLLAQTVLRSPLAKWLTQEYDVTGSWAKPAFKKR